MAEFSIEEHKKWYESQRPIYEALSHNVEKILESLLRGAGIDYLSITTRAKDVNSFTDKIGRKNYQNPSQEVTDLAGVRVITFIESDALKVNELIKVSFNVDDSKSLDKSDELGIDRFGYRSFHFICDLGDKRCALPEFRHFENLFCEIQVRTVLQHAWAEIEHDRNYKFAGELPSLIKRRLNLIAGLLEVADGEFNNLSNDIDKYSIEVLQKAEKGELDIELNSISLYQYLQNLSSRVESQIVLSKNMERYDEIIKELILFDIKTIAKLDELFSEEFINVINEYKSTSLLTFPDLIRDAMIFNDIDKYFEIIATPKNAAFDKEMFHIFAEKYGTEKVADLFNQREISVLDWENKTFILGIHKGKTFRKIILPDSEIGIMISNENI